MKRFILIIAILIFCSGHTYSEELILEEIEVKGKKETEVESLEVREVRESFAVDTAESLQDITGISKVRKGAIANDVVIRGFQKDNVNVLIDGMKLYGACPNRMDPPAFHIDFAEVERIDILKGAFDVKNQGSLGGLVDIKTKSAEKGFHGEVNLQYGSFNNFSGSSFLSYGGSKGGISAGGAYKYSKPYEDGDGNKITDLYSPMSSNRYKPSEKDEASYNIKTGWTKIDLIPVENHKLEVSYTRQEADDVIYPYLLMDAEYDDADRVNAIYTLNDISNIVKNLKIQAYWSQVEHDMRDERRCSSTANVSTCSGDLPRSYGMKTFAETNTWGGKVEGTLDIRGETTAGVDYYQRNWDATTTMYMRAMPMPMYKDQASMPDVDVKSIGAYIEQNNELTDTLNLSAGLRIDNTETEAGIDRTSLYDLFHADSTTSRTDTYLSGNMKIDYDISDSLNAFIGFGHTVRVPDPEERYFALQRMGTEAKPDRVGNPELDTVKNNEFDTGLKYKSDKILLKTQLFYSALKDMIVIRDVFNGTRHARVYTNKDATMYGGEASARLALPKNIYVTAGISYTRGENDTDDTNLPEMPPVKGNLALRYDNGTYFGEIQGLFASKQSKVDELIDEEETGSWAIANVKVGYLINKLNILAGIKNIFDKNYFEHLSYQRNPFSSGIKIPEPGRTLYVSTQYDF